MSDLWRVYRLDGSVLGPLSSQEIREGLREGRINPFDQVCREGGSVRLELLEADDIFMPVASSDPRDSVYDEDPREEVRAQPDQKTMTAMPKTTPHKVNLSATVVQNRDESDHLRAKKRHNPAPNPNLEGQGALGVQEIKAEAQRTRRYFVINKKKRTVGPLSAAEIQSLYFRGVIEDKAKVVREGAQKKVSVASFVEAYNQSKRAELRRQARVQEVRGRQKRYVNDGMPNSRMLDELSRSGMHLLNARRSKKFPTASLMFLAAATLFAMFGLKEFAAPDTPWSELWQRVKGRVLGHASSFPEGEGDVSVMDAAIEAPATAADENGAMVFEEEAITFGLVERENSLSSKRKDKKKNAAPKPKTKVKKKEKSARKSQLPMTPKRSFVGPQIPPARVNAFANNRPQVASMSSPYAAKLGSVTTLSGLSFSKGELNACQGQCQITFRDRRGNPIKGLFFKDVFAANLLSSRGTVSLTGRVSAQGAHFVIFVQGVGP